VILKSSVTIFVIHNIWGVEWFKHRIIVKIWLLRTWFQSFKKVLFIIIIIYKTFELIKIIIFIVFIFTFLNTFSLLFLVIIKHNHWRIIHRWFVYYFWFKKCWRLIRVLIRRILNLVFKSNLFTWIILVFNNFLRKLDFKVFTLFSIRTLVRAIFDQNRLCRHSDLTIITVHHRLPPLFRLYIFHLLFFSDHLSEITLLATEFIS